jgi:hypothetical protein
MFLKKPYCVNGLEKSGCFSKSLILQSKSVLCPGSASSDVRSSPQSAG